MNAFLNWIFPKEPEMRRGEQISLHELKGLLMEVHKKQGQILRNQETIMHTLDDVLADIADEKTQIGSLTAFIAGLKQQIADALAGTTLPPAVQSKIDAVFDGVEANKADVVKAMAANVPTP